MSKTEKAGPILAYPTQKPYICTLIGSACLFRQAD